MGGPFHARGMIVAIVVLALFVRVAVIIADTGYVPQQDAWDYDRHARSIASGDGYPDSYYVADRGPSALRAPGYPYFLAAVYVVSGDSVAAGRLANAALGALAVFLLYQIVRRIWGRRTALVAAAMAAIFPPLVLISRDLLSESLFIAMELGMVLAVLEYRRLRLLRWAILAGALAGFGALTRNPGPALAVPLIVGLWVVCPRLTWRAFRPVAIGVACMVAVVFPWTVRNAVEFGRLIPITSGTGFALAGTYNEVSREDAARPGAWRTARIVPEYVPLFAAAGIDEGTLDATLRTEAMSFAVEHPGYVATVIGWNLMRLFEISGGSVVGAYGEEVNIRGIGSADSLAERLGLGFAAVFAFFGVFAIRRSRRGGTTERAIPWGPLFLWLLPIMLILVTVPINGLPRQRTPVDPFILILAAVGGVGLWDYFWRGRVRAI